MSEYDASGGGVSTGDSEGSSGSEEGELYQVGDDVEELMPSTATYVDRGWWVNVDEATGMKYWYNDAEPDDIRFEFPAELEDKRAPTPHVGHEQAASPSDAAHGSGGEHEETEGGGEGVEGYEGYEGYEGAVEAQTAYGEGDGGASPPAIAGLAVGGDALESYGYHGHGETSVEASSAGVQQQGEGSFSGYYGGAWERRIDPDSGWAYYINTVTLESVVRALGSLAWDAALDAADNTVFLSGALVVLCCCSGLTTSTPKMRMLKLMLGLNRKLLCLLLLHIRRCRLAKMG